MSSMLFLRSGVSAQRVLPARPCCQRPALRQAVVPHRALSLRLRAAEDEAKQAAEKAASTATETPKEVAEKVEEKVESATKGSGSFGDAVDNVGREISKFTQETSGLTQENTSIKKKDGDKPAFEEAMSFSGQVPERANSRLAMVAFVAAAGAELATGSPVAAQLKKSPLLIGATFIVFMVASIIPIVRGEDPNKESGPFTVRAELWNGRLAMLGFIALLLTETFKSTPAL